MKATIKPTESFIITIGETECAPFTKESSWNGLSCYKNKHGVIIAVDDYNFIEKMFCGLINNEKVESKDLNIITCSPCFIQG